MRDFVSFFTGGSPWKKALAEAGYPNCDDGTLKPLFEYLEVCLGEVVKNNELPGLLSALDGKYIIPGPGGDPIRNPDVLPTGKNMHALDPQSIPTMALNTAGLSADASERALLAARSGSEAPLWAPARAPVRTGAEASFPLRLLLLVLGLLTSPSCAQVVMASPAQRTFWSCLRQGLHPKRSGSRSWLDHGTRFENVLGCLPGCRAPLSHAPPAQLTEQHLPREIPVTGPNVRRRWEQSEFLCNQPK